MEKQELKKLIITKLTTNEFLSFEQITTLIDEDLRYIDEVLEELIVSGIVNKNEDGLYQLLVSTNSTSLEVSPYDEYAPFEDELYTTEEDLTAIKDNNQHFEQLLNQKKVNRRLLIRLCCFVLCSIIYLICQFFSKFPTNDGEINQSSVTDLPKYYMYFNYFFSVIIIVYLIVTIVLKKDIIKNKAKEVIYEVLDWVVLLPICIVISTICFTFLFTYVSVEGVSMNPTFNDKEQLFIVNANKYERFDVVVIHVMPKYYYSIHSDTLYLKRIIGLPGEEIKYVLEGKGTNLYVRKMGDDDFTLVEEYFYNGITDASYYTTNNKPNSTEVFDFIDLCKMKEGSCVDYNGNLYIPEGYYFVLGDNRYVSNDSRNIGLVRKEDILGTAKYRVESFLSYRKVV